MKLRYLFSMVLIALSTTAMAQHRKVTPKAKAPAKAAAPALDLHIYRSMIPSTAKVLFVDSVVVPIREFLDRVPLSDVTGSVTFRKGWMAQYENSFSGKRFFASGDSAVTTLWSQSLLGNGWTRPQQLKDISEDTYRIQNYPFLAADGVTLYFSAEGPESMGGRDIFMTSFNSDKGAWLEPQNYGLPFNSTANEYLLAIDDVDSLGWLVTDRRQPKDSVCIYTFVPTAIRKDFQEDDLTDKQIERYSRILAIRDTWGFGNRKAALQRLAALKQRLLTMQQQRDAAGAKPFSVVINDERIVSSPNELHNPESPRLFAQLQELHAMITDTRTRLDDLRTQYAEATVPRLSTPGPTLSSATVPRLSTPGPSSLASSILSLEKALRQQLADQHALTLRLRALELAQ